MLYPMRLVLKLRPTRQRLNRMKILQMIQKLMMKGCYRSVRVSELKVMK